MPLSVLAHHHRGIVRQFLDYPGVPPDCDEDEIRQENLQYLQSCTNEDGSRRYPNIDGEAYVEEKLRQVRALRECRAAIIPDYDPVTGERNFDGLCGTCGNKLVDSKGRPYCAIEGRR